MSGISGYGTTLEGFSTGTIVKIREIGVDGMEVDDIEVSDMKSTNRWKEFIAGMMDAGEISLDLLYEKANHDAVQSALGGSNELWTIEFPDGSTFACNGYLKGVGIAAPHDDGITQEATLKLSGAPEFVPSTT